MRDEMREVLNLLLSSFPSLDSWFSRQDESLMSTWSRVLDPVDPHDAMTVIERFIRGELDLPPNYEYDRLAILIRRESSELARQRHEVAENDRRRDEKAKAFSWLAGEPEDDSELARWRVAMRAVIAKGDLVRARRITHAAGLALGSEWIEWWQNGGEQPDVEARIRDAEQSTDHAAWQAEHTTGV